MGISLFDNIQSPSQAEVAHATTIVKRIYFRTSNIDENVSLKVQISIVADKISRGLQLEQVRLITSVN